MVIEVLVTRNILKLKPCKPCRSTAETVFLSMRCSSRFGGRNFAVCGGVCGFADVQPAVYAPLVGFFPHY